MTGARRSRARGRGRRPPGGGSDGRGVAHLPLAPRGRVGARRWRWPSGRPASLPAPAEVAARSARPRGARRAASSISACRPRWGRCSRSPRAQPVVSRSEATRGADGAEVLVVLDVTRSMLARRARSEPTRLERGAVAKELRARDPGHGVGVASLTDRVLRTCSRPLGRTRSSPSSTGRSGSSGRRPTGERPRDRVLGARRPRRAGVLPARDRQPARDRRHRRRDAPRRLRDAPRAPGRGPRVDHVRPGLAGGRGGLRRERRAAAGHLDRIATAAPRASGSRARSRRRSSTRPRFRAHCGRAGARSAGTLVAQGRQVVSRQLARMR